MDVTRYTYTPLNPYQGPREAGERDRSPAARTRRQGPPGRDAGPRSTWMAVSLTPRWILPLTPPVRATNVQQPSAQQGSKGHERTIVTHTGPPVGLTGGIPKLATLVPDLSPTPCTPCAPSRRILAASTQPRAPGETRADLGVKRLRHLIPCHACPKTLRSHGVFEASGSPNGVG